MEKYKLKLFSIMTIALYLLVSNQVLASSINGIIDPSYHFAWGENVGWIDFGSTSGNVHITDDALSGYAYGENIGFINLSTVTNDKEGHLGGYAWGENVGWIDFSGVTIDNHGYFAGSAYGENIGFITFDKDNENNVMTDWRPKSSRSHGSSSGGSISTPPPVVTPPTTPNPGCSAGNLFNTNTGQPCAQTLDAPGCSLGSLFNTITGVSCGGNNITPIITSNSSDGQATLNIIRTLKLTIPRMTGQDVKDLQTYLNTHNYNSGTPDGIFGAKTKQAVINFQVANGLIGDGVVGALTRSKLK